MKKKRMMPDDSCPKCDSGLPEGHYMCHACRKTVPGNIEDANPKCDNCGKPLLELLQRQHREKAIVEGDAVSIEEKFVSEGKLPRAPQRKTYKKKDHPTLPFSVTDSIACFDKTKDKDNA